MNKNTLKIALWTGVALVAFAANSVLCRLALAEGAIDAGSFTVVRLVSGVVVLALLSWFAKGERSGGSWLSALMLFVYAAAFSFAYNFLDTATGALILFAAVQFSMIFISYCRGMRLAVGEFAGILVAFSGFVYLLAPDINTPSINGFALMSLAGLAWGIYTLQGRGSSAPLTDTFFNFLRTLPFVAVLLLVNVRHLDITGTGILLAVLSGGLASGLGYAIWYLALGGLSATQAAVLQLLVPIIAALGGLLFAGESPEWRLVVAAALILGGILLVILQRRPDDTPRDRG